MADDEQLLMHMIDIELSDMHADPHAHLHNQHQYQHGDQHYPYGIVLAHEINEQEKRQAEENERLWFHYILGAVVCAKHRRNHASIVLHGEERANQNEEQEEEENRGNGNRARLNGVSIQDEDANYEDEDKEASGELHGYEAAHVENGEDEDGVLKKTTTCHLCWRELSRADFYFDILFHTMSWHAQGLPTRTAILAADHPYIEVLELNEQEAYDCQPSPSPLTTAAAAGPPPPPAPTSSWFLGAIETSVYPLLNQKRKQYNAVNPPLLIVGCSRIEDLVSMLWKRYQQHHKQEQEEPKPNKERDPTAATEKGKNMQYRQWR